MKAIEDIKFIHTLGPINTNCEQAAYKWLEENKIEGEVFLHNTLEDALLEVKKNDFAALLGCVVYPDLHKIVFSNLNDLSLVDCFIMPTYNMILATNDDTKDLGNSIIATHPAPSGLAYDFTVSKNIKLVNSNSQAALQCSKGLSDACITILPAAQKYSLKVIKDFGEVPMGFTIHY